MHRVTHPVPRAAVPDPEAATRALQEEVVVRVLVIRLNQIVVDILHRHLGLDAVEIHRLQLEHDQRTRGVLRQRLIDPDPDLAPGRHLARDEVGLDELVGYGLGHGSILLGVLVRMANGVWLVATARGAEPACSGCRSAALPLN
jgi:hypothetical protein